MSFAYCIFFTFTLFYSFNPIAVNCFVFLVLFGSYTYTERELSAIIATYLEVHVANSQLSLPFKEFDSRLQEIFFFNPVLPFLLADKKKIPKTISTPFQGTAANGHVKLSSRLL